MRRSTRRSSVGLASAVEEAPNSKPVGSFGTRFSLSSFVKRVEKLTDDQRTAIKKVGFGNLLLIPNQMMSKSLLAELMERWDSEERGFKLLPGIVKITLMDVALILGIRVTGNPVLLREDHAFCDLETDYGAALWKRKITVASLESRLDSIGQVATEDFLRTFILFTFGTILFPDASGKVDSRYLSLLKSLDDIGHFAWGAAVLEDVIMWLNKRKESNVQYVGGCLVLLQVWCYEHIDLARPDLRDCQLMFPRACRWENSKSTQRQWFAAKFRELQDFQITWQLQPTSEELQFNVINELLEVESSSIDNSSDHGSIIGDTGLEVESVEHHSFKVEERKEIHLKKSTVSQNIPEVQTMGLPSTSNVSLLHKHSVEISAQCQNSEKLTTSKVVGLHLESGENGTSEIEVQDEEVVNLNQSTALRHLPEVQTDATDFPLMPPCVSELHMECGELPSSQGHNSTSGNEDELVNRNQKLEIEIKELRKKVEALELENRELKMQICSTNDLMTRLEELVMDETLC